MAARGRSAGKKFYVYLVSFDGVPLYVGKGADRRMHASARKHGGKAEVLEWCENETHAFERERHWITELQPTENRCPGGNGGRSGPTPLVPLKYRGVISEREMRKLTKEHEAFEREFDEVGPRRMSARMLLRFDLRGYVDPSKVEAIRQVAYGPRC
jgi:hypothetical protein